MAKKVTTAGLLQRAEQWESKAEKFAAGNYPQRRDVGFYCWGDAPGGIGGGVGWFYWFRSRAGMLRTLQRFGFCLSPPRAALDLIAIDAGVAEIVSRMAKGVISDAKAVEKLNVQLRHIVQFDWIGEHQELAEARTKFARQLHQRFRGEGEEPRPITPDEREDWFFFLEQAGL